MKTEIFFPKNVSRIPKSHICSLAFKKGFFPLNILVQLLHLEEFSILLMMTLLKRLIRSLPIGNLTVFPRRVDLS